MPAREDLLAIYAAALKKVNGRHCVSEALSLNSFTDKVIVVAIGKAASSMAQGACDALGDKITEGLLITKTGHGTTLPNFTCIESGHPLPDENSLLAGQALLDLLQRSSTDAQFLFLISGGASALVEVLPEGLNADDLQRINNTLLSSGLDIQRMNRVRTAVSEIKGGRLAKYVSNRRTLCLLISDVIGDDPAVIGSGLLVKPATSLLDLADITLPPWLTSLTSLASSQPSSNDSCFDKIETKILASIKDACQAAANEAEKLGYDVFHHQDLFCCDAESTAKRLATQLLESNPGLHIWGGETTVELPDKVGRGGRNQHLALAAAEVIAGHSDCWLLAAGTDGSDGPTSDAGGLVDGGSTDRMQLHQINSHEALQRFDAGTALEVSGDLITTGPTGTNIMDIVLGLKGL